jgi:hypothetical protein
VIGQYGATAGSKAVASTATGLSNPVRVGVNEQAPCAGGLKTGGLVGRLRVCASGSGEDFGATKQITRAGTDGRDRALVDFEGGVETTTVEDFKSHHYISRRR